VDGYQELVAKRAERIPLQTEPTVHNRDYLRTKAEKMGHLLDVEPEVPA